MKKVISQFEKMHKAAFLTLRLCLSLILLVTCILYIYIDNADKDVLFALSSQQKYLTDSVVYSVVLALGGAFLLDYTHTEKQ